METGFKTSVYLLVFSILLIIFDLIYIFFMKYDKIYDNDISKIVNKVRIFCELIGLIYPSIIIKGRSENKFLTDDDIYYREKFCVYFGLFYSIAILIYQIVLGIINWCFVNDEVNVIIYLGIGMILIALPAILIKLFYDMSKYTEKKALYENELDNNEEQSPIEDVDFKFIINMKTIIKIDNIQEDNTKTKKNYLSIEKVKEGKEAKFVLCNHNKGKKIDFNNMRLKPCQIK